LNKAAGQVQRVSRLIEINRQFFSVGHLAEIRKIRRDDWNPVGTSQMCHATATRRRGVGHDGNRGTLEKIGQLILMHVTGELNCRIPCALFFYGFDIAGSLGVVATCNDQLSAGQDVGHSLECIDHKFETLVGSPLAKGKDAVLRIAAPRKIGVLGSSCQNAVRPDMNILAAIFFREDPAIARHEYGHRIREQQHPGSHCTRGSVSTRVSNARILQINGIHQVMQGNVSVAPTQTGKQRSKKAHEGIQGIASKSAEEQIEPHYIRLQLS